MIGLPPFDAGVDHDTVAWVTPGVADGLSGADGGPKGVATFDVPAAPLPRVFDATTEKVYGVPFVSPDTVQVRSPVVVHVRPPGEAVTV